MKYALHVLFLFFTYKTVGQIPDYFSNSPKWFCSIWNSDQWNIPSSPHTENYIYYINGDTNALGFTYHKIFKKGYRNYESTPQTYDVQFNYQTSLYLRQDGRSIRYYDINSNLDSLLVSYEYNVGDIVKGNVFQTCHSTDTVQKIDSLWMDGTYRRRIFLDTIIGPIIIEGIGHLNEINNVSGEFLEPLCIGIGFDYSIHCFAENDIPKWQSDNSNDCILNMSTLKNENTIVRFYPNPTNSTTTLFITSNYLGEELFIYNQLGDLIKTIPVNSITILISFNEFSKGVYFYMLADVKGKFIIQ